METTTFGGARYFVTFIDDFSRKKEYWGEAVVTAAYIINRSPTRVLSDITPEELWSKGKPDLSHMKIFGCKAMVLIPKECRRKLDAKSRELIFVGYCDGIKGYRFMDPKTKKVITSREAVFLEETIKRNKIDKEIDDESNYNKHNIKKKHLSLSKTVSLPMSETDTEDCGNTSNQNDKSIKVVNVEESQGDLSLLSQDNTDSDDSTYSPGRFVDAEAHNMVLRSACRKETYEKDNVCDENYPASFVCNAEATMSILDNDPQSLSEALQSTNSDKWIEAMNEEYQSLLSNNTWTLVDKPKNNMILACKWIFKTKTDQNGQILRYKARLVVKGCQQKKGIHYNEIYAPVIRYSSMRYMMGLAIKYNLKLHTNGCG
ncbi:hypothetical protein O3G_MSEX001602 [Manduca sexta]|nr:hypothetical protein O3G_MSEX001602 [Manduca sexta]